MRVGRTVKVDLLGVAERDCKVEGGEQLNFGDLGIHWIAYQRDVVDRVCEDMVLLEIEDVDVLVFCGK